MAAMNPPPQRQYTKEEQERMANTSRWELRSKDGKLDTEHLKAQASAKARNWLKWKIIGACLALGLVVLMLLILGGAYWYMNRDGGVSELIGMAKGQKPTAASKAGAPIVMQFQAGKVFRCAGDDEIQLEASSVDQKTPDQNTPLIEAGGNCKLTLKDPNIKSNFIIGTIGNGEVTLEGGSLAGTPDAIKALGSGHVVIHGTKITGNVQHWGAATIERN